MKSEKQTEKKTDKKTEKKTREEMILKLRSGIKAGHVGCMGRCTAARLNLR